MDNAMVKRGIGAVVLAIIAALLLGYLLKDKSRERQDVVEMELPGTATDNKIPSLSATAENGASAITEGANNLAENTGSTVITAAAGAGNAVTTAANNAADTASSVANQAAAATHNASETMNRNPARPGFSIRPAAPNEQRETVNPNGSTQQAITKKANNSAPSKNNTVVANSSGNNESYKPRLIKERKTRIVSSSQDSNSGNKPKPAKKSKTKSTASETSTSKGGYAIQLMATASQSRAEKLAKTMKSEGYGSFITRTTRNNKVLYRVRVRAGANRNAALATQKKMKRRYQKNFFVQNSLVVSN